MSNYPDGTWEADPRAPWNDEEERDDGRDDEWDGYPYEGDWWERDE